MIMPLARSDRPRPVASRIEEMIGWHYLSNATSLIQPQLFYACFVEYAT